MIFGRTEKFSRLIILAIFMLSGIGFFVSGCAGSKNAGDSSAQGTRIADDADFPSFTRPPGVAVAPDSISLGIANLMDTEIVFQGWGFKPDDSVFISLLRCEDFELMEVIVGGGRVDPDGTFKATVTPLTKVVDILKGDILIDTYSEDGEYGHTLLITQETIPAGDYLVRATSLMADEVAETWVTIKDPSLADRLKDWVGIKLGRIKDERS